MSAVGCLKRLTHVTALQCLGKVAVWVDEAWQAVRECGIKEVCPIRAPRTHTTETATALLQHHHNNSRCHSRSALTLCPHAPVSPLLFLPSSFSPPPPPPLPSHLRWHECLQVCIRPTKWVELVGRHQDTPQLGTRCQLLWRRVSWVHRVCHKLVNNNRHFKECVRALSQWYGGKGSVHMCM